MKNINNAIIDEFIGRSINELRLSKPKARYLEVGCGDMRYAKHLDREAWDCVFTDYESRSPGVTLLADAHALPFGSETFDVVVMTEVLEHLHSPELAIKEVTRVLGDSGVLILTVPFMYQLHEMPSDYVRWTEFMLSKTLASNGMSIVKFERRADAIGVLFTILQHLSSGLAEFLTRRAATRIFAPIVSGITAATLGLAVRAYVAAALRSIASVRYAGEGLTGVRGHLQLWHLGYNVVCAKRVGPS
ncbi:class I SAM-dependent methyltransferase [Brevundimonas staleyi]|uniref:Class I SAM-dependent methyltransferase n=1 Tax=Brevundimonas staleyi TaxID=74326 RepID=A0ABW0FV84_9CAUL